MYNLNMGRLNIAVDDRSNIDVIMGAMASQITGVSIVCSNFCSDTDQRKHQSSASLAFARERLSATGKIRKIMMT